MTKEQALQELEQLRKDSTTFYEGTTGKAQLTWLDEFESNLITSAINVLDPVAKADFLNQAKGLRAFRAYLDTLTKKD